MSFFPKDQIPDLEADLIRFEVLPRYKEWKEGKVKINPVKEVFSRLEKRINKDKKTNCL